MLLIVLTLIWGSSYILMKKAEEGFSPVEMACLRISISFLASLPFTIKALRHVPRNKWGTVFFIGLFGSGIPAFLFAFSISKSESGLNGIINSLSPLWTLLIGYFLFGVLLTKQKVLGVITGFIGAAVLVLGKRGANFEIDVAYSMLPVMATFCYGVSSNLTKQYLQDMSPIYTTGLAMSMIGLPALAGLFFTNAPHTIAQGTAWWPLCAVVILALFGTLVAWVLFYKLVQRTDALTAASVTYLIPIVAVGWGLLDGEVFNLIQIGGMVLILIGVYFTTKVKTVA